MKALHAFVIVGLSLAAATAAYAKGDSVAGKALHEAQCNGCHAGQFSGDGGKIYTRPDRRVQSLSGLAQMVSTCNANLGLGLFPDDEANLSTYLNQTYYKFK